MKIKMALIALAAVSLSACSDNHDQLVKRPQLVKKAEAAVVDSQPRYVTSTVRVCDVQQATIGGVYQAAEASMGAAFGVTFVTAIDSTRTLHVFVSPVPAAVLNGRNYVLFYRRTVPVSGAEIARLAKVRGEFLNFDNWSFQGPIKADGILIDYRLALPSSMGMNVVCPD
ncbi:MAG: hypothetical protein JWN50_633 [Parcubacteria group bacterium]|nr:hypothetical protein [Parcubacteria group bacterium]